MVRNGKPVPPERIENRVIVIVGTTLIDQAGDENLSEGTLTLDPSKAPKAIDAAFTERSPKGRARTPGIPAFLTSAYNPGNFRRQLMLPREVKHGSLTTQREELIKIGAKVVRHAKAASFRNLVETSCLLNSLGR